jgi:hypothetical protein
MRQSYVHGAKKIFRSYPIYCRFLLSFTSDYWLLGFIAFPDRAVKLCRPYINLMFGEKTRLARAV